MISISVLGAQTVCKSKYFAGYLVKDDKTLNFSCTGFMYNDSLDFTYIVLLVNAMSYGDIDYSWFCLVRKISVPSG